MCAGAGDTCEWPIRRGAAPSTPGSRLSAAAGGTRRTRFLSPICAARSRWPRRMSFDASRVCPTAFSTSIRIGDPCSLRPMWYRTEASMSCPTSAAARWACRLPTHSTDEALGSSGPEPSSSAMQRTTPESARSPVEALRFREGDRVRSSRGSFALEQTRLSSSSVATSTTGSEGRRPPSVDPVSLDGAPRHIPPRRRPVLRGATLRPRRRPRSPKAGC